MAPALVLTQAAADELGYTGAGPFTLAGAFPGEYLIDEPLALKYLGFDDEEEARAAFDDAFVDADVVPLAWTTVAEGEGLPIRQNHALSDLDVAEEIVEEVTPTGGIRSHKDADKVAAELGISFPEDAKLDDKRAAIDAFRTGGAAEPLGDPNALTPALGAEDTTPPPPPEEEPS